MEVCCPHCTVRCVFFVVLITSLCFSALYLDYSGLTCYEAFILSNNTGYYEGGAYVYEAGLVFNGPVTISGNKATYSDGYTGGMLFVPLPVNICVLPNNSV